MLKKNQLVWTLEAKETFIKLNKTITKPLVLAPPNFIQPFVIKCEALGKVIMVVLMQKNRSITYVSQVAKGRILA